MDKAGLFERCTRFEQNVLLNASSVVEPWTFGRVVFDPGLAHMYFRNVAFVESDTRGADAQDVVKEIEDKFAVHGVNGHRKLAGPERFFSDDLVAACRKAGWERERLVTMVYGPSAPPAPAERVVREVSAEEYKAMTRAVAQEIPDEGSRPEVVEQIVESAFRMADDANARFFAAYEDGAIVSGCHLYSDGVTAQIEDVGTLAAHRRRGLSNAVVRYAVRAALAAEHELVFLVADDEDWPKDFYGRIGFEEIGYSLQLLRKLGKS